MQQILSRAQSLLLCIQLPRNARRNVENARTCVSGWSWQSVPNFRPEFQPSWSWELAVLIARIAAMISSDPPAQGDWGSKLPASASQSLSSNIIQPRWWTDICARTDTTCLLRDWGTNPFDLSAIVLNVESLVRGKVKTKLLLYIGHSLLGLGESFCRCSNVIVFDELLYDQRLMASATLRGHAETYPDLMIIRPRDVLARTKCIARIPVSPKPAPMSCAIHKTSPGA